MGQAQRLPTMEHTHHEDITDAAKAYVKVRDQRMKANDREAEAKEDLRKAMEKHELELYEDDDALLRVRVSVKDPTVNVKVERLEEPEE